MKILLIVGLTLILGYWLLLLMVPKKTLLHELIHLPLFWLNHVKSGRKIKYSKHAYGSHRKQYLLDCRPTIINSNNELSIVYIHGGGWRFGKPEHFLSNARFLNELGFRVFMLSHRKAPRYKYPAQREDMNLAIKAVSDLIEGEPKIILGGMSSGANLIAHLLYDRQQLEAIGLSTEIFKAAFFCGGPLNIAVMKPSRVLLDFSDNPKTETFQKANPFNYIQAKENIPVLFIQGTHDGMVPYRASRTFYDQLKLVNANTDFFTIDNGTHLDACSWPFRADIVSEKLVAFLSEG